MSILIGSTGFVGGHLSKNFRFDQAVHRPNVEEIRGTETDLLICAGLPAEKWKAIQDPQTDFSNMADLSQILSSVRSKKAVLISTIDVYQPAVEVDESNPASLNGTNPYGRHRAWFEVFFKSNFPDSLVIRLPGLFASDVRKNLIHDLIHKKHTQIQNTNKDSKFQFFNVNQLWDMINFGIENKIQELNVTSEPITAQEIASIFHVELTSNSYQVTYDMRSNYAQNFNGKDGYFYSKEEVIAQISELKANQIHL